MTSIKPILYNYWISSCSWRVRAALAYKGIDYEYKSVNLIENEQEDHDVLVHTMGQVPIFVHEGRTMTQSLSILEFLEEKYPQKPLLPQNSFDRAKVREICEIITSGIQPLQNIGVTNRLSEQTDPLEWAHFFNMKGLKVLEVLLKESSGKYCVGDDFTMADCCLAPQLFSSTIRFNVSLEKLPILEKIYKNLLDHPAIQTSHPAVQSDVPS